MPSHAVQKALSMLLASCAQACMLVETLDDPAYTPDASGTDVTPDVGSMLDMTRDARPSMQDAAVAVDAKSARDLETMHTVGDAGPDATDAEADARGWNVVRTSSATWVPSRLRVLTSCRAMEEEMALDGDPSDFHACGEAIMFDETEATLGGAQLSDNVVVAWSRWTSERLWIAYEVTDPDPIASPESHGWGCDALDIHFDPRSNTLTEGVVWDDRQIAFDLYGTLYTDELGEPGHQELPADEWVKGHAAIVEGGYVIEIAIAWSWLRIAAPAERMQSSVLLAHADCDQTGPTTYDAFSWTLDNYDFSVAEQWGGVVRLKGRPDER